jgi:hypothetical protein
LPDGDLSVLLRTSNPQVLQYQLMDCSKSETRMRVWSNVTFMTDTIQILFKKSMAENELE